MINTDHPARGIPSLAAVVATIDDATDLARFRPSPAAATAIALNAAHEAYQFGRRDAIAELLTVEDAAAALGIDTSRVRRIAKLRGLGWQISRGTWLFQPADIDAMRERKPGRPSASNG